MNVLFVLVALVALVAIILLVVRVALAIRSLNRARASFDSLRSELDAAHNQCAERYRVHLPGRQDYESERYVCDGLLQELDQRLTELTAQSLATRLTSTWSAQCEQVHLRAQQKVRDLQAEVFWAQFKPGSAAAESRYQDNTD